MDTLTMNQLPEIGTLLSYVSWNGKTVYYRVTGYTNMDALKFAEGEQYVARSAGESVPLAIPSSKKGKDTKYPAARLENWKEWKVA